MPDLQNQSLFLGKVFQLLALLQRDAHGLFQQYMLARKDCLSGAGHVELVADADDHRVHLGICQHPGKIRVGHVRVIHGGHLLQKILRHVTDGIQMHISCLGAADQVRRLADDPTAQHAHIQKLVFLFNIGFHV